MIELSDNHSSVGTNIGLGLGLEDILLGHYMISYYPSVRCIFLF